MIARRPRALSRSLTLFFRPFLLAADTVLFRNIALHQYACMHVQWLLCCERFIPRCRVFPARRIVASLGCIQQGRQDPIVDTSQVTVKSLGFEAQHYLEINLTYALNMAVCRRFALRSCTVSNFLTPV